MTHLDTGTIGVGKQGEIDDVGNPGIVLSVLALSSGTTHSHSVRSHGSWGSPSDSPTLICGDACARAWSKCTRFRSTVTLIT